MLRVSFSDNTAGQRWKLSGHLAGPWVEELRSCWSHQRGVAPLARAIVDLSEVTFIDESGESLLSEMHRSGTEFVTKGVANKDLIASLQDTGKRPLRRLVEHLGCGCCKPKESHGGNE